LDVNKKRRELFLAALLFQRASLIVRLANRNTESDWRMVILSGKTLLNTPSGDLVETSCCLQLAFGSVTQAFDSVVSRFDFGELTGNKLLS
jgi:hypothetical protein